MKTSHISPARVIKRNQFFMLAGGHLERGSRGRGREGEKEEERRGGGGRERNGRRHRERIPEAIPDLTVPAIVSAPIDDTENTRRTSRHVSSRPRRR